MHNLSCENEFYTNGLDEYVGRLQRRLENKKSFLYQRLSFLPRFDTEARWNSEMAYYWLDKKNRAHEYENTSDQDGSPARGDVERAERRVMCFCPSFVSFFFLLKFFYWVSGDYKPPYLYRTWDWVPAQAFLSFPGSATCQFQGFT